jgi:hydrogenase maturation protease
MKRRSILVIGLGNTDRGDDAAGREVARRLREAGAEGADIVELGGEATALLAAFEGAEAVFLVDACLSGAPPGTIRRLDVAQAPLPRATFGLSSHGFGLAEALELAETLRMTPPTCIVYAIEAQGFEIGAPISAAVARSVDEVVGRLRQDIASLTHELKNA